ncbi:alpha/beta hydrolase [Planctomycetota bacterium]
MPERRVMEVKKMVLRILIIIGASYVGLALYLYLFQAGYVYYPIEEIYASPGDAGLPFEDAALTAEDGASIAGWYVPAENARGTVLFCHGNGGNISHRLETLTVLNALRLNVLIFDYRSYGASKGKLSEKGTYLDAEAAWRYVTEKKGEDPSRVVIFGRSLGGAIASWLAATHTPGLLIVESAFTSMPDIAGVYYPYMPVRLLCRIRYPTIEYLAGAKCPVLVVHSPEDEMIPFRHGQRLFETAPEPKEFMEIVGGHNDGFLITGGRYERGLEQFIDTHLPRQTEGGP